MTFEKIRQIVAEQLNKNEAEITMDSAFIDDLGADSLDLFQIITELEDAFEMEFPQDALEKIVTIGDAVKAMEGSQ